MTKGIDIFVEGCVARIVLDRPQTLNAITHDIIVVIEKALSQWSQDDAVRMVLIEGTGERAFSAGGDLTSLFEIGRSGNTNPAIDFWRDEYRLNAKIDEYSKPYVAFMHGFVMGGGVGLSAHGSHRVVTDNSIVAMPECAIGLIPDVGGTHLLAHAPGYLGEFLGLTGTRMNASDAVYAGFADYIVPQAEFANLKSELAMEGDIAKIQRAAITGTNSRLRELQPEIDEVFSAPDLGTIVSRLAQNPSEWCVAALEAIRRGSPISLIATLAAVRKAKASPGLRAALERELSAVSYAITEGDFLEGIRAAIIDKDRSPKWKFASVADVPEDVVERVFAAPIDGNLLF